MSARSFRKIAGVPTQTGSAKVKLGIRNTADSELLGLVRTSVQIIEDDPNFPDPMPSQDVMEQILAEFSAAIVDANSARSAAMAATARKDEVRSTLEKLYSMRGNYVALMSGGDDALILAGGMKVRNSPSPIGELAVPGNLFCELNGVAGIMNLSWDVVKNAQTYFAQMALVTPGMVQTDYLWESLKPCPKRKLTVKDLQLGQCYAFRVAAVGGKTGQGPWSPPVKRTAG